MISEKEGGRSFPWLLVLLGWVAVSIFFTVRIGFAGAGDPLIADTDDAMRLVVVHDFLAGQNWYDNVQYRLNTPFGAEIHWSRLVDLPIGASRGLGFIGDALE